MMFSSTVCIFVPPWLLADTTSVFQPHPTSYLIRVYTYLSLQSGESNLLLKGCPISQEMVKKHSGSDVSEKFLSTSSNVKWFQSKL